MRYCTGSPRCRNLVTKGRCPEHSRQYEQQVRGTRHARGYDSDWDKVRAQFIEDNYPWFCAIDGPECLAKGRQMERSEIQVDHIIPFKGLDDPLRLDQSNLRIACATCHIARHAGEAHSHRGSPEQRQAASPVWSRYVVVGPPGCGKTLWVEQRAVPGDLVFDFDALAHTMSRLPTFPRPPHVASAVLAMREGLISWLLEHKTTVGRVFIIVADAIEGEKLALKIGARVERPRQTQGGG